jgi:hypothetical protein
MAVTREVGARENINQGPDFSTAKLSGAYRTCWAATGLSRRHGLGCENMKTDLSALEAALAARDKPSTGGGFFRLQEEEDDNDDDDKPIEPTTWDTSKSALALLSVLVSWATIITDLMVVNALGPESHLGIAASGIISLQCYLSFVAGARGSLRSFEFRKPLCGCLPVRIAWWSRGDPDFHVDWGALAALIACAWPIPVWRAFGAADGLGPLLPGLPLIILVMDLLMAISPLLGRVEQDLADDEQWRALYAKRRAISVMAAYTTTRTAIEATFGALPMAALSTRPLLVGWRSPSWARRWWSSHCFSPS